MRLRDLVLLAVGASAITSASLEARKPSECTKRWTYKLFGLDFYHLIKESERDKFGVAYVEEAEKPGNNPLGLKRGYHFSEEELKKFSLWADNCIDYSKNKNCCLVVDKAARQLDIYLDGNKVQSYPVGLGRDPYLDKQVQGDLRTPEGNYWITGFNPNSQYHKSLKVSYPNHEDKKEFQQLRKEGKIQSCDSIGGDIYLHGESKKLKSKSDQGEDRAADKATDWTHGCIALSNNNLDDLIRKIGLPKNGRKVKMTIIRYGTKKDYR